jgi:hypothetical protein
MAFSSKLFKKSNEFLELLEGTGIELTGVCVCYINKHSQPHTAKVNGRLCKTHKEVRHDFRRPQEEACRSICDVPARSCEKGGGRTVL